MYVPIRVRGSSRKPVVAGAAGVLLALLILPALASESPSAKKPDTGNEYSRPAAPLTAEQQARLAAKRAMVERMTPAPAAVLAPPPVKPSEAMTVTAGAEGVRSLKEGRMPAPGTAGIVAPSADPGTLFGDSYACRAIGICKREDRIWTGSRSEDVSARTAPARREP
jgi:hypothetical protein